MASVATDRFRLVRSARGLGIEVLEPRVLLSVSQDPNGWTAVTPSADTRIIYVSSSLGNDANSGTSVAAPVQSLSRAASLVRSGFPDWILLRCGDVFNGSFTNWSKSGRSADEPMLIGNYGDGARPLLNTGTSAAGLSTLNSPALPINYVDVIGLQFYENNRDPASPTFNPSAAGGGVGFQFYAPGGNVLIEDCSFRFYRYNLDIEGLYGPVGNITVRRCVVADAWSSNSHSEGIYAYSVDNIALLQNVFDHNGWNAQIAGAKETGFNHNIYFSSTVTGADIEENIIANASYAGVMARSGGIIDDNLFLQNTVAVVVGNANGADSTAGGVTGSLVGNVVVGDKSLGGLAFGQGFEIGNTQPAAGLLVANNIFTQDTQHAKPAIQLTMATDTYNPQVTVGENDVTIQNNIVNGWWESLSTDGRFVPGGTGLFAFNNVSVLNNDFINATDQVVRHDGVFDPTQETWAGNRYYTTKIAPSSWMSMQGNPISSSLWVAAYDPTGTVLTSVPYADPNRSAATYDATAGGPGTLDDFLAQARLLSITNYRPQYMARAVMDYVRKGFTLDTTAPVAAAAALNVGAAGAGATTYTFTVTYTDDFFLDPSSLGSSNLLVTGPNGYIQIATFIGAAAPTVGAGGSQSTVATYQIVPPAGGWAVGEDGTYMISLKPNQVTDMAGNTAVAGTIGSFNVDLTPPLASALAEDVTDTSLGTSNYSFTVTYSDASAIDGTTLANSQLEVTGPNSYEQFATLVSATPDGNASCVTATYSVPAPDGIWTPLAAGVYSITANAGGVRDTFGNALPAGLLATFNANFLGVGPTSTPGSISGTVFNDSNGNGLFDGRDLPLIGVLVFADLNGNGKLDGNDPRALTDIHGNYTLTNLPAGRYTIIEQLPGGYQARFPAGGSQGVTVMPGQDVTAINFADQFASFVTNGSAGKGKTQSGGNTKHPNAKNRSQAIISKNKIADIRQTYSTRFRHA